MKKRPRKDYKLEKVFTFGTIEDFWGMYNNTINIKSIIPNTDYLLFKEGVKPEWEDPANEKGGKWVVTVPIEDDMEEEVEHAWEYILLGLIGGQFD